MRLKNWRNPGQDRILSPAQRVWIAAQREPPGVERLRAQGIVAPEEYGTILREDRIGVCLQQPLRLAAFE